MKKVTLIITIVLTIVTNSFANSYKPNLYMGIGGIYGHQNINNHKENSVQGLGLYLDLPATETIVAIDSEIYWLSDKAKETDDRSLKGKLILYVGLPIKNIFKIEAGGGYYNLGANFEGNVKSGNSIIYSGRTVRMTGYTLGGRMQIKNSRFYLKVGYNIYSTNKTENSFYTQHFILKNQVVEVNEPTSGKGGEFFSDLYISISKRFHVKFSYKNVKYKVDGYSIIYPFVQYEVPDVKVKNSYYGISVGVQY